MTPLNTQHCQEYAPTYTQIATLLNGIVPVGAVDAASDGPQKRIAEKYGITSFPTMKIFGDDKDKPIDVPTDDPSMIMAMVMDTVQKTVQGRAGSEPITDDDPGYEQDASDYANVESDVVIVDSSNISELVYDNEDVVMLAFAAPWCGHCKNLLPEWESAAMKLNGNGATLAWVDATMEESLAKEFGVKGFPTIKVFSGGKGKSAASAVDYQGGRQTDQIVAFALDEVDRTGTPKEIEELTSEMMMGKNCGGGKICIFFALPHILDSGAEGRNKYRETMTAASKAVRGMNFNFMWFEGGSQTDLEQTLELTFGFPAVAAYSADKGVYSVHRASYGEANIRKWLLSITTGRQPTYKVSKEPMIELVEPWDGQEGKPVEEEFSLDEIMGWDDDADGKEPEL